MFLFNDVKAESTTEVLVVPDEDASVMELMSYNYKRLMTDYFGEGEERANNLKLLKNFTFFALSVLAMNQSGHRLAV
ncbi:Hypothetical Protein FCC1311_024522 [Hondaea fermentalgiana]|uniref:Uncharacterized protein n=1 Tax=Hondaea fermentalgiana TaxID=2315210 RepID=A0A2R5GDH0_9STRA|nr:Hypothetical Protein FCC1311_024522 [Hondaea fermentalgiana]|eukprot:GBG26231.1 Hypothetical Protein FCC1311_024522 [Hondaea fermentalgiana]